MTFQGDLWGISLIDIPDFDKVITGCGGEDILGGRVEDDLSNFPNQVSLGLPKVSNSLPSSCVQLSIGTEVLGDPSILSPSFKQGVLDLPDTDCLISLFWTLGSEQAYSFHPHYQRLRECHRKVTRQYPIQAPYDP
jgi:hypothetical protein